MDIRSSEIKVINIGDAPFLIAEAPPSYNEIDLSPGMVRAFFTLCKDPLVAMYRWEKRYGDCPPDGIVYYRTNSVVDPQSPQNLRMQRCNSLHGETNDDLGAISSVFKNCVYDNSIFVIAHEFAHKVLHHGGRPSMQKEIQADDCARVILGEKTDPVFGGYFVRLLGYMINSNLFGLSGDNKSAAKIRIDRLKAPLPADSTGCNSS